MPEPDLILEHRGLARVSTPRTLALLRQVEPPVDRPVAPAREGAPMSDMSRRGFIAALATGSYFPRFALGRRCEADRRARRVGRFAGTFLVGSGLTAGP
jgi:hypothetical protein